METTRFQQQQQHMMKSHRQNKVADEKGDESDHEELTMFKKRNSSSSREGGDGQKLKRSPDSVKNKTTATDDDKNSFTLLDTWLQRTVAELRITKPTPIQTALIGALRGSSNHNKYETFLASSPTGTGKTAAFALPILDELARDPMGIFTVVLTPTRELAIQIGEQFEAFGASLRLRCCVIIGGQSNLVQQAELAKFPHILVATPGRLAGHLENSSCFPRNLFFNVRYLVLDEADRLLSEREEEVLGDLRRIAKRLPPPSERKTVLVSATFPGKEENGEESIFRIGREIGILAGPRRDGSGGDDDDAVFRWHFHLQEDPRHAKIAAELVEACEQRWILAPSQMLHAYFAWFLRVFLLPSILEKSKLKPVSSSSSSSSSSGATVGKMGESSIKSIIVFAATCEQCELFAEMLNQLKVPCAGLHSNLTQSRRLASLSKFREGAVPILLATDVASRGLDIPNVDVVLNLGVPRDAINYVHRIGRTARAGRRGRVFTFVSQNEVNLVKNVEKTLGFEVKMFSADDDEVGIVLSKASEARRKAAYFLARKEEDEDDPETVAKRRKKMKKEERS